jgi:hypothetical protein
MRIACLALAVQLVAAAAHAQSQPSPPSYRITSLDGGFSVDMPCPTPTGDAAREGVLSSLTQGHLVSEERITLGGYPGRSLQLTAAGDLLVHSHFIILQDKNRLLQALVVSQAGLTDEQQIATLLDSLAILPDTPPGIITSAEVLSATASITNRTLPMMIDKETELTGTARVAGIFVYRYRLVNYTLDQVDPQKLLTGLRMQLVNANCTNPDARDGLLKQGVTLRHIYSDKDLRQIASIDITLADCK